MEIISLIITIGTIIYKIVSKASESSSNSSHNSYTATPQTDIQHLNRAEKLQNMDVESLIVCYKATATQYNSIFDVENTLHDLGLRHTLSISDVIKSNNCIFIRLMYAIPFNSPDKCHSTALAIYYMEPNKSVSVYGPQTWIQEEELSLKEIANQLTAAFSK